MKAAACGSLSEIMTRNVALIGAGAIVRGKVPDNSLVIGVPGQIRPLSEKQAERLKDPTAKYVQNGKRFNEQGLGLDTTEFQAGS